MQTQATCPSPHAGSSSLHLISYSLFPADSLARAQQMPPRAQKPGPCSAAGAQKQLARARAKAALPELRHGAAGAGRGRTHSPALTRRAALEMQGPATGSGPAALRKHQQAALGQARCSQTPALRAKRTHKPGPQMWGPSQLSRAEPGPEDRPTA